MEMGWMWDEHGLDMVRTACGVNMERIWDMG